MPSCWWRQSSPAPSARTRNGSKAEGLPSSPTPSPVFDERRGLGDPPHRPRIPSPPESAQLTPPPEGAQRPAPPEAAQRLTPPERSAPLHSRPAILSRTGAAVRQNA